ncbi:MAG: aspartyl protease family protein [Caulobacter sp.]|nr:aspartyl protease family protein [Caulobacter sp.]
MFRRARVSWALLSMALAPAAALAGPACQVAKFADLPVTMSGARPTMTMSLNGREGRFLVDSGAFYSTISAANAQEFGLSVRSLGPNVRLSGVGGETSLGVTTVKTLTLAGQAVRNVDFAVGGGDTGFAGIAGQNILGLRDVEYDLPHGAVRLMKVDGCRDKALAYWATDKPFSEIKLIPSMSGNRTIGVVKVNGVELKALFDTGAGGSVLMMSGARRLGLKPDSEALTADGLSRGLGRKEVRSWRTRLDTIEIGGELIRRPTLGVLDQSLDEFDMLIGIDFFLSHRLIIDNDSHRMFLTYEGGPIFGLDLKRAVTDKGEAIDLTDKTEAPTDAPGWSQRGAVALSKGKTEAAIADFDKAIALDPKEARYLHQRAQARLVMRQLPAAMADLDKAVALAPDNTDVRMTRAQLRLAERRPADALEDLDAADKTLAPSSDARLRLGGMNERADRLEAAVANYDLWLKAHPEDSRRGEALNGRCWARALMNKDLNLALADCDAAVRFRPGEAGYLDSRALVRLRRGELDKALADYDAALKADPRQAWSLYMRAVVERRAGKTDKADADRAQALSIDPQVAERAKRYGLES